MNQKHRAHLHPISSTRVYLCAVVVADSHSGSQKERILFDSGYFANRNQSNAPVVICHPWGEGLHIE